MNEFRLTESVRVICRHCGRRTPKDVPRLEGPRYYPHVCRHGRERHRLVVAPDPFGSRHLVVAVKDNEYAHELIRELLESSPAFRHRAREIAQARLDLLLELDRQLSAA